MELSRLKSQVSALKDTYGSFHEHFSFLESRWWLGHDAPAADL
jgi:hypothetical protein